MRTSRWMLLVAALLVAVPSAASAQWGDILALSPGDSLRLRVRGALPLDATMRGMRSDTLLLGVRGLDSEWPVSGYDLVSLERFGERSPRQGLRNGALLGTVTGLFAGAAVGLLVDVAGSDREGDTADRVLRSSLRWAGLGAVTGGVAGAMVGSRRPGWGWIALEIPVR